jgi:exopolysaccharide biosynthesis glucuronosyltransferase PssE
VKIFVTVGTQLPFDRLIKQIDWWAGQNPCEVFAQIGRTTYQPRHVEYRDFIETMEAGERIRSADLVITHAGMGTILTRLEAGKPIIVVPRLADRGEHRNNHQLATVRRLGHLPLVHVVRDERDLEKTLNGFDLSPAGAGIGVSASSALVTAIKNFVTLPKGRNPEEIICVE